MTTLALLLSASTVVLAAPGGQSAASTASRAQILAAARDIIGHARYCNLVTLGDTGHPQARIVDPIAPDAEFTVWIATNTATRKVGQIRRDGRVTMLCFDAATASYVTLLGRADLVSDSLAKKAHWKPDWAQIYKDGPGSKNLILIRVTPMRLEIVSESRGLVGDPKTWLPLAIDFPK